MTPRVKKCGDQCAACQAIWRSKYAVELAKKKVREEWQAQYGARGQNSAR